MSYYVLKNCNLPGGKDFETLHKEYQWKNGEKFENFLNFITEHVKEHKEILSNELYKKYDYKLQFPAYEFDLLMNSLYEFVIECAKKNNITCCNPGTLYCLKIKDKFYSIGVIYSYGVYIKFALLDKKDNLAYIDLDKEMKEL